MSPRSSGSTSIASTSAPAFSASRASSSPDASSASRRETRLEIVRTAVRTACSGRRVGPLRGADQIADRVDVAVAQEGHRIGLAVDDRLEELLAVLVGGQRALRPAAGVVE